ncbi:hypothetical protein AALP_AA3G250900 [Arabis alpina]|uniref:Uncharacterized protein n=1 Tax=Arabis alpina TaxID=50452 RepID=A0A087HBI9_ARAAL|nr:hypothetical protein AALP_AA3G250900 [Arabis alpina]
MSRNGVHFITIYFRIEEQSHSRKSRVPIKARSMWSKEEEPIFVADATVCCWQLKYR